ncbi:MAG: FAD-dependent oxidoreductase [Saprospiraceae bacterium]
MSNQYHTIIIGAGMSGMAAANTLANANVPTLVLDKGRGISGRMATRRWEEATFDHGAQFFSARTPAFQAFVEKGKQLETVQEWWPSIADNQHPRWIGSSGMNTVPKMLVDDVPILKNKKVIKIKEKENGWEVLTEDEDDFQAKSLLITIPAPQAIQLLENSGIALSGSPLPQIAYHPCLVVLAKLDRPSGIPAPGGLQTNGSVISWIADNFQKGISKTPCVTIHASPEFSTQHLDGDLQSAGELILEVAKLLVAPAHVQDWQIHRWRYSLCYQRHVEPFWRADMRAPLLFGGDGFGMGNVEGAFVSGVAMAKEILEKTVNL